jgi:hypothetical protein
VSAFVAQDHGHLTQQLDHLLKLAEDCSVRLRRVNTPWSKASPRHLEEAMGQAENLDILSSAPKAIGFDFSAAQAQRRIWVDRARLKVQVAPNTSLRDLTKAHFVTTFSSVPSSY